MHCLVLALTINTRQRNEQSVEVPKSIKVVAQGDLLVVCVAKINKVLSAYCLVLLLRVSKSGFD